MFAIFESGGKQYKVVVGNYLKLPKQNLKIMQCKDYKISKHKFQNCRFKGIVSKVLRR